MSIGFLHIFQGFILAGMRLPQPQEAFCRSTRLPLERKAFSAHPKTSNRPASGSHTQGGPVTFFSALLNFMYLFRGQHTPLTGCEGGIQGKAADGCAVQAVYSHIVHPKHPLDLVVHPLV